MSSKLTFKTQLTNGSNNGELFDNFIWFKDWCDSEGHFQGPKRGFTVVIQISFFKKEMENVNKWF